MKGEEIQIIDRLLGQNMVNWSQIGHFEKAGHMSQRIPYVPDKYW
jgi:hypothetical protein